MAPLLIAGTTTGCLGAWVAGKVVDDASCAATDLVEPHRQAYVDLRVTEPVDYEVDWAGRPRAADCDSGAGLGGTDGAYVFFDEFEDESLIGFLLADEDGLGEDVPTALIIDDEVDDQAVLFWAGLDCTTDVTTYENLANGWAYIEGSGECFTSPLDPDEAPKLAAEYSFANVVLTDPYAAAYNCC